MSAQVGAERNRAGCAGWDGSGSSRRRWPGGDGRAFFPLSVLPFVFLLCVALIDCGGTTTSTGPPEPQPPTEPPVRPVPCNLAGDICEERVVIGSGVHLRVFSTHALTVGDPAIERGMIVVHGNNRDPDNYFVSGITAATNGGASGTTAVVAPYFQTVDDGPASDEAYWSSPGWKRGNLSRPEGPSPRVSSYAALDSIVNLFLNVARFPALREIVVTGHSAGGQVLHRYAATGRAEESAREGVAFRYVAANPSTWLYLGPERENASGDFTVPGGVGCDDYNEWHYGLDDRNSYANALEADTIGALLTRRDVRILIGDADTLSASLDVSCGANLQGANRFLRGRTLVRYMDALHSGHRHVEMIVPGVGHSNRSMWTSPVGLRSLFGS